MTKRQAIGAGVLLLVIGGNVAAYRWTNRPAPAPPDVRRTQQRQLGGDWAAMDAARLDGVAESLRTVVEAQAAAQATAPREMVTVPVEQPDGEVKMVELARPRRRGLSDLDAGLRAELVDALAGAIEAVGANDPDRLFAYLESQGQKPQPESLLQGPARGSGARDAAEAWQALGANPRWRAFVPDATRVRVWRPRSHYSMDLIQLGRNESFAWSNGKLALSTFNPWKDFAEAAREELPMLADARVLIEHDDSLDEERSPYFFRFWLAEEAPRWRPFALKLVRTVDDPTGPGPVVVF